MADGTARLTPCSPEEREGWRARLGEPGAHATAMASLAALHEIELDASAPAAPRGAELRVVTWNLERGTRLDAAASSLHADVMLATELDVGMARSANRHAPSDLAAHLGHTYAFGVEFMELGLGDANEAARLGDGAANDVGFHGNAITANRPIDEVALVRIEQDGSWFEPHTDQPRVGGRMALAGRVDLAGRPVVVCAVHLESESDPALRRDQLAIVLDAIDDRYGDTPAVVGGDLNTFSASQADVRREFRAMRDADPTRFTWPVPYEPLFELAAQHGFDHEAANPPEQTMRLAADQRVGSLLRLDWLLVRGLEVVERATLPAVGDDGRILSDHDGVAATLRHRG